MRLRHLAAPALALAVVFAGAAPVLAEDRVGTGISAGPVVLADPAHAGATYGLPDVTVANTGSAAATYTITTKPIAGQRDVPGDWVRPTPGRLDLAAGQLSPVHLSLVVPSDAQAGDYHARIEARVVPSRAIGSGAAMGVAASTDLRFTVIDDARPAVTPSTGTSVDLPPWLPAAAAAALVVSLLAVLLRRAGVSVSIERRS